MGVKTIKIGVIGYRKHASRLIDIIDQRKDTQIIYIYHPTKSINSPYATNYFQDLYRCDAVLIVSPNSTHFEYIKKLLKNEEIYIFCEKPPVNNIDDLQELSGISVENKGRLFFNFNLRFGYLNDVLSDLNYNKYIGEAIHVKVVNTHGLAFKEEYKNSWRADRTNNLHAITDTVAIHYIDLLSLHFGEVISYCYTPSVVAGTETAYDTVHLSLEYRDKLTASIFVSYACPLISEFSFIGTNGLLSILENQLKIFSPRDTFDDKGLFKNPPLKLKKDISFKEDYILSLSKSLSFFIEHVKERRAIDTNYFDISVSSNQFILQCSK